MAGSFFLCFSFVVCMGFVLKAVCKVRDTAMQKLNQGQKRNSPLTLCVGVSQTHTGQKNTPKHCQLCRLVMNVPGCNESKA